MRTIKIKRDDKIKCADCGELLTADNAWWAFGKWWHRLVDECNKYKAKVYNKSSNSNNKS